MLGTAQASAGAEALTQTEATAREVMQEFRQLQQAVRSLGQQFPSFAEGAQQIDMLLNDGFMGVLQQLDQAGSQSVTAPQYL